jgi:hypothetical protein
MLAFYILPKIAFSLARPARAQQYELSATPYRRVTVQIAQRSAARQRTIVEVVAVWTRVRARLVRIVILGTFLRDVRESNLETAEDAMIVGEIIGIMGAVAWKLARVKSVQHARRDFTA